MPLTPHDEDIIRFPEAEDEMEGVEKVQGMEIYRTDPTISYRPQGESMGLGDSEVGGLFSNKTFLVIAGIALALGAWWYMKGRKK